MPLTKLLSLILSFCLILEQSVFAQTIDLSHYFVHNSGQNIPQSDKFRPLHLRYISYDSQANDFKVLLDKGDFFNQKTEKPKNEKTLELENTTQELMKYFFIGLSLPNEKFWVNLRPDSPDNILDPDLEKTDIGRIFLEADLQLKKDTASFTSPQNPEGKAYWDKLYKKAGELFPAVGGSAFGGENITIPTITRPWIVPNEIIIREAPDNAYIYKATLKVMLEEDYLDQKTEKPKNLKTEVYNFQDPRLRELNQYSTQLIKETIIPKLTYAVNTSKRYAQLRQVYYSLILAQWFKQKYGSLGSASASGTSAPVNSYIDLIDSGNLANLTSSQPYDKQSYFQQYQKSFKGGEYNLQELVYTPYGQTIKTYFSGGTIINTTNSINRGLIPTLRGRIKGLLRKSSLIGLIAICLNMSGDVKISVNAPPQEALAIKEEMPEVKKAVTRADVEEISVWELFEGTPLSGLDYKWYHISDSQIYYLEFNDYSTQNQALNRLGIFVESRKYAGKILSDTEIEEYLMKENAGDRTLGIGHDYVIERICAFYTKARQEKIPLNSLEEKIKNDLLRKGFLKDENGKYEPLEKIAVISSTPETTITGGYTLRAETILHEWRHGLFMTEPYIRDKIKELWRNLTEEQRGNLTLTIQALADYNPRDEDLILGEVHASLLDHTSLAAGWIFGRNLREQVEVMQRLYEQFKKIEDEWKARKSQQKQEEIIRDLLKKFLQDRGTKDGSEDQSQVPSSPPSSSITAPLGGIDFRYLPIITQVISNLSSNINSSSINRLRNINLDSEWRDIENLVNSGITPSPERIKEYIQVSCYKGSMDRDIDKVISCIADILRIEEERYSPTNPTLKDILAVLDSSTSVQQLKAVFIGTTP